MNLVIIIDPNVLHQRQIINLPFQKKSRRVVFEAEYLEEPDLWFISFYNAQDNSPICTKIPLIASHKYPFNILEPFQHKNVGWMLCVPLVDEPSSDNPSRDNMGEFGILWGDSYDRESS